MKNSELLSNDELVTKLKLIHAKLNTHFNDDGWTVNARLAKDLLLIDYKFLDGQERTIFHHFKTGDIRTKLEPLNEYEIKEELKKAPIEAKVLLYNDDNTKESIHVLATKAINGWAYFEQPLLIQG